jgi:hypothetical protein
MKYVLCVLLCVLLVACSQSQITPYKPIEEYRTGSQGLTVDFFPEITQQTHYENSRMNFGFYVHNKGAYDVEQGQVSIAVTERFLSVLGETSSFFSNLGGRSDFTPLGERISKVYRLDIGPLDKTSVEHSNMEAAVTLCYPYVTTLATDVCVNTDPYNPEALDTSCTIKDITTNTQGAPLAIKKVEIHPYYKDEGYYLPEFTFHIENVNKGIPFRYDKINEFCSAQTIEPEYINQVLLFAKLSDTVLVCDQPVFHLIKNEATVTCGLAELLQESSTSYVAPLYVELNYGYSQSFRKEFSVKSR